MHEQFAGWLGRVHRYPNDQLVRLRWQGIESTVTGATKLKVLDLAKMAFNVSSVGSAYIQEFRAFFQSADASFLMQENDAELSLLAGSALAELFATHSGEVADVGAMATMCRSLARSQYPDIFPELVTLADSYLKNRSVDIRQVQVIDEIAFSTGLKSTVTRTFNAFSASLGEDDKPKQQAALTNAVQTLAGVISGIAESAENSASRLKRMQELAREEIDVLWWTFNARSRDLDKNFMELELPEAALPAGNELATLTAAFPGLLRAEDFLSRVLSVSEGDINSASCIKDVVNATSLEWRKEIVDTHNVAALHDVVPIMAAIIKSLETGGKDDWIAAYEGATGLDPQAGLSYLDLARQLYFEVVLDKAIGNIE